MSSELAVPAEALPAWLSALVDAAPGPRRLTVTVREYADGDIAREVITEYESGQEPEAEPVEAAPVAWANPATWWRAALGG